MLLFFLLNVHSFSQKNFLDQAYIETTAKVDSLVSADEIIVSIQLNESDSRNRETLEEKERKLLSVLERQNIDLENDFSVLDLSSNFRYYFLKGQQIIKSKLYEITLHDAKSVSSLFQELEDAGISNVDISNIKYSKSEELLLELKSLAVQKAQQNAQQMAASVNQSIGKAVYISDVSQNFSNALAGKVAGVKIRGYSSLSNHDQKPKEIEFKKVNHTVEVQVKFLLQ